MSNYLEVWGDTVDSRHMATSIWLGVGIATPTFLISRTVFSRTVENQTLAGSYALLLGLAGCLVAAVIAARLFKPKRIVQESHATLESRQEALDAIVEQGGEWTDPADLDPAVQDELRQLGLYDVLTDAHEQALQKAAAAASTGHGDAQPNEKGASS